jgi:flagellar hook-length control protein FliK
MDQLPISTLPTPTASSAAESAADAGASANTPPEDGFQAVLSRSLAGGALDPGAAAQDAAREENAAAADDALASLAEGALNASDSALALLAALPQQAARAEAASSDASARPGDEVRNEIANAIDIRAGGRSASSAARRPHDAGKEMAELRPGDIGPLSAVDLEKIGETAARGGAPITDSNAAAPQQTVHAAYAHASLVAPDSGPSAPGPVAQPRIDTPLGAPGWSTALAEQLIVFAGEKQQIAELRINPPHLGPVDITLTVSDDQANAVFASPHAVVRETIESALPRLREVLAESGINLGQASVTADSPRDGAAQAQSRSGYAHGRERSAADGAQPMAARALPGRALPGLVDLFA